MKLKMYTRGKMFDKICLKTIKDPFLQYVVCDQERHEVRHKGKMEDPNFWWEVISNRSGELKILHMSGENPPVRIPFRSCKSKSPYKEHPVSILVL